MTVMGSKARVVVVLTEAAVVVVATEVVRGCSRWKIAILVPLELIKEYLASSRVGYPLHGLLVGYPLHGLLVGYPLHGW